MGTRAPSIHQIGVNGVGMDDDKKQMESVDFNLSVDYSGGLGIAIDVALAYGKSAFLSAKGTILLDQSRHFKTETSLTRWLCHIWLTLMRKNVYSISRFLAFSLSSESISSTGCVLEWNNSFTTERSSSIEFLSKAILPLVSGFLYAAPTGCGRDFTSSRKII